MQQRSDAGARQKVWSLIKDIKVAQLVTYGESNRLHARPMAAVQQEKPDDLWFFTRFDSPKIAEIAHNPSVLLSYSEPADQNYVSISGTASVSQDRAKIHELWSEWMRTWFPKGKDDPAIALIRVEIESAEYWDSPSSAMVYAYGYVKARLTGEMPDAGENAKVDFAHS